jgi:hypothetical protein
MNPKIERHFKCLAPATLSPASPKTSKMNFFTQTIYILIFIFNLTASRMPPFNLSPISITHTLASFHIDSIRDPHPKFGWWWLPKAWQARWKRNKMKKGLLKALE